MTDRWLWVAPTPSRSLLAISLLTPRYIPYQQTSSTLASAKHMQTGSQPQVQTSPKEGLVVDHRGLPLDKKPCLNTGVGQQNHNTLTLWMLLQPFYFIE